MKSVLLLLCASFVLMLSGIIPFYNSVNAELVDRFRCMLDGDKQVPPNNTHGHGFVGLKFTKDARQLVYNVNVNNVDNITAINLYSYGNNTQNASMLLDLLKEAKELKVKGDDINITNISPYKEKGTVALGGVTSDDLQGELKGKSLADLIKLMKNGGVYVEVQTIEFPLGEIRGNEFVPIDRIFPDITDFQWD
jgi:CHRD domain